MPIRQSPIEQGANIIEFTKAEILAGYEFASVQYAQSPVGFYLNLRYPVKDDYIILDNFIGVYADDYEPAPPPSATLTVRGTNGMTAFVGEEFSVPACEAKNDKGGALPYEAVVEDKDGNTVPVEDNKFTASVLGDYTITYSITQSGYDVSETLVVHCKKGMSLNEFSSAEDLTFAGIEGSVEAQSENTLTGQAVKLSFGAASAYSQIFVPLKDENGAVSFDDLKKFEKLQAYIYVSSDMILGTCVFNEYQELKRGWNIFELSMEGIKAAQESSEGGQYRTSVGLYLCLQTAVSGEYMIFDRFAGIYADDYEPEPPPEYVLTVNGVDGMTAVVGEEFLIPSYAAQDGDGNALSCSVTVKDKNGNAVAVENNRFTPSEIGEYTITYSIDNVETDVSETLAVSCKKGKILNDFTATSKMTYVSFTNECTVVTEGVPSGSGVKVTATATDGAWGQFCVPLYDGETFITLAELKKFEKIRIELYSTLENTLMLLEGSAPVTLQKGWNVVEFKLSDIEAALAKEAVQYSETANGFRITQSGNFAEGDYYIFSSIVGVYPENYAEPEA